MDPVLERMATVGEGFVLESQGLVIVKDVSRQEWEAIGRDLVRRTEASVWALGDWLVYGGRTKRNWLGGSSYEIASKITGYSKTHLSNAYRTSAAFARDDRRPQLSWSVHRESLRLPVELRGEALREAVEHRWSELDMAVYIDQKEAAARRQQAIPSSRAKRPRQYYESPKVRCPKCQHEFPIKGNKVNP